MRWAGHVGSMGEMKNVVKTTEELLEGNVVAPV
jgi:hypothetical protein